MRARVIAAAIVAVTMAWAAPAGAHTKSYPSTVTATFTPMAPSFSLGTFGVVTGQVGAGGGCKSNRTVTIDSVRTNVARVEADSSGAYTTPTDPLTTNVRFLYADNPHNAAAVRSVVRKGNKHTHKCKASSPAPFDVFPP